MKTYQANRIRVYCPDCGKTSTFILMPSKIYQCAGDERSGRVGCGKVLRGDN